MFYFINASKNIFISFVILASSSCVLANNDVKKNKKSLFPAPIASMIEQGKGVKFQDKFDAPGGMKGYVLSSSNGERRIYYVTPDGKYAILGIVFDENLNNITAEHQKTYMNVLEFLAPRKTDPSLTLGTTFGMSARNDFSYSEGEGIDLYIVFDSECVPCAKTYFESRKYLKKIKFHWIPSAFINEKSSAWMNVFLMARQKDAVLSAMFSGKNPPSGINSPDFIIAQERALEIIKSSKSKDLPISSFEDAKNSENTILGALGRVELDSILRNAEIQKKR